MFAFCKPKEETKENRVTEVGWLIDNDKGSFIWDAPRKLTRPTGQNSHVKSVSFCPAVHDHDARLFEVTAPFDIQMKAQFNQQTGEVGFQILGGDQSTIRPKFLGQMFATVNRSEWRHPNRPIIQFMTPYMFISDEPVYMTQLAAFYHYPATPLPGLLIGGRFPIHIWPRGLTWAFEWYDTSKELMIKRGDPWFYVQFETMDPSRRVRLIEAEMTPELQRYTDGIKGVTNYVSRTFSLFKTAQQRRPKTLLVPKKV